MKTSYSALAILLLCLPILASAEVYRWTNSEGRVQYSDQPPPDVKAEKITNKPATGRQGVGSKTYQEQDQEFRKRRVEEEESAKKKTDTERQTNTKQKNCSEAKAHLASLQAGGRFTKTNEKGEREVLEEKGVEAAIADAKQSVADWCK
jgi:hypothetical protein